MGTASSLVSAAEQFENNTLLTLRLDKEVKERPMTLDEAKAEINNKLYEKNALKQQKRL